MSITICNRLLYAKTNPKAEIVTLRRQKMFRLKNTERHIKTVYNKEIGKSTKRMQKNARIKILKKLGARE